VRLTKLRCTGHQIISPKVLCNAYKDIVKITKLLCTGQQISLTKLIWYGVQNQFLQCEDSKRYGMKINTDKTKTMVHCRSKTENDMKIALNGKALENVDSFIYLGSLMTMSICRSVKLIK